MDITTDLKKKEEEIKEYYYKRSTVFQLGKPEARMLQIK